SVVGEVVMGCSLLVKATQKALGLRLQAMGFEKGTRDGVYRRALDPEGGGYFTCRPRTRAGQLVLQPVLAIGNLKVQRLSGDVEPKQQEPRIANVFLSYTIGRGVPFWSFSDVNGMNRAIDAIERALRAGGIPFAERWTPFRAALDLLRRGFSEWLTQGGFTHPTRSNNSLLETLPGSADHLH